MRDRPTSETPLRSTRLQPRSNFCQNLMQVWLFGGGKTVVGADMLMVGKYHNFGVMGSVVMKLVAYGTL